MIYLLNRMVGIVGLDPPKREGLIYIPDSMTPERKNQGIIKYMGPNCKIVQLAQHVIFGAYRGNVVQVDDEELIVMDERYLAAVLDYPRDKIEVPGLYHKYVTPHGGREFKLATYETAVPLLAKSVQFMSTLAPKDWAEYKPADYDVLEDEEDG